MALLLPPSRRISLWAFAAFLLGFGVLLVMVSKGFLLPALEAAREAQAAEKQQLVAHSRLLLAVLLVILFSGLVLSFRLARFFFPRPPVGKESTEHIDAWQEAGRRMKPPEE